MNRDLYPIADGAAAETMSQPRRQLLAVGVIAEQDGLRRGLPAKLTQRGQASLRLIFLQLRLSRDDNLIRDGCKLRGQGFTGWAYADGVQRNAQRIGQPPACPRQPLRGAIVS